jgi:hypothetical protein
MRLVLPAVALAFWFGSFQPAAAVSPKQEALSLVTSDWRTVRIDRVPWDRLSWRPILIAHLLRAQDPVSPPPLPPPSVTNQKKKRYGAEALATSPGKDRRIAVRVGIHTGDDNDNNDNKQNSCELWTILPSGQDPRRLTRESQTITSATFSPDASSLVYTTVPYEALHRMYEDPSVDAPMTRLLLIDLKTGKKRAVGSGGSVSPHWLGDGSLLYFGRTSEGKWRAYRLSRPVSRAGASAPAVPELFSPTCFEQPGAFSPDGGRVLGVSGGKIVMERTFLRSPRSFQKKPLTGSAADRPVEVYDAARWFRAQWSPSGAWISLVVGNPSLRFMHDELEYVLYEVSTSKATRMSDLFLKPAADLDPSPQEYASSNPPPPRFAEVHPLSWVPVPGNRNLLMVYVRHYQDNWHGGDSGPAGTGPIQEIEKLVAVYDADSGAKTLLWKVGKQGASFNERASPLGDGGTWSRDGRTLLYRGEMYRLDKPL